MPSRTPKEIAVPITPRVLSGAEPSSNATVERQRTTAASQILFRFTEFDVVGSVAAEGPEHEVVIDLSERGARHDELPMDEQVVDFP